jgi:hypothetical protein
MLKCFLAVQSVPIVPTIGGNKLPAAESADASEFASIRTWQCAGNAVQRRHWRHCRFHQEQRTRRIRSVPHHGQRGRPGAVAGVICCSPWTASASWKNPRKTVCIRINEKTTGIFCFNCGWKNTQGHALGIHNNTLWTQKARWPVCYCGLRSGQIRNLVISFALPDLVSRLDPEWSERPDPDQIIADWRWWHNKRVYSTACIVHTKHSSRWSQNEAASAYLRIALVGYKWSWSTKVFLKFKKSETKKKAQQIVRRIAYVPLAGICYRAPPPPRLASFHR